MKTGVLFLYLIFLLIATSCTRRGNSTIGNSPAEYVDSVDFEFNVELKYARKIFVKNYSDHKEVYILNPSGSDTIATYILALRGIELLPEVESKGAIIRVPIQTVVCLSATHVGALEVLDLRDNIAGATNITRFWDKKINELSDKGKIKEVGVGMKPDNELIITLKPDVVIKNDHSKNIKDKEMADVGINTIFYNDWRENTLLARAEWLKMMGLLFCRNRKSDSLFQAIENRYDTIKTLAITAIEKPNILITQDIRGTWYMPGDQSYVPSMIRDAYANTGCLEGVSTSLPCSFEKVYENHHNDKYWLSLKGGVVKTLKDFGAASEHYSKFDAFKTGNVYINNKRVKPGGGNDFWESGTYNPDVILKDLIKIFHPELLPDYETYYWQKLE